VGRDEGKDDLDETPAKAAPPGLAEYEIVAQLIQDTGQTVWTINGAYLLAATVLLSVLGSLLADPAPGGLSVIRWGALLGLLICVLWWAAFERAYGFYNLRIHYARRLERMLGFQIHELGRKLDKDKIDIDIPASGALAAESYPVSMLWIGRLHSSQAWTRWLMGLFAGVFILLHVLSWVIEPAQSCAGR